MKNKGEDEISWQLYAKRVFVFEKKDRVYLEGIKITFFEKGEVLSVLRAKEAQQDLNKSQTIFQNEVVITSPEGVKLETEEIKWKMEGKKFTSKKKVKITTEQGHIVRGEGIVADLSLKILKIKKPFLK
jgi:LPS export ABC transporter protein LptC